MKTFTQTFLLVLLLIVASSCTKDDGYIENLDEQGLTQCPENSNCKYVYTNHADLPNPSSATPKNGSYRVFWTEISSRLITRSVFIKAPMKGNAFSLTDKDIQAGNVMLFNISCPTCFSSVAAFQINGGYIRGKKLNSTASQSSEKWLLETKLFLSVENTNIKDTISIKQYYNYNP